MNKGENTVNDCKRIPLSLLHQDHNFRTTAMKKY